MAKSKIDEMIKSKQAPGQTGKNKKYFVDHRTVWDGSLGSIDPKTRKRTGGVLVTAEVADGRRVIETSDSELQEKLEARGYKADSDNKLMHSGVQPATTSIKSADRVNIDNQ